MTHDWPDEVGAALVESEVVAITSGITDLREAAELLDARLPGRWTRLEWGMGSAANRARFHAMQQASGFTMLPMFIGREGVIGGMTELRHWLRTGAGRAEPGSSQRVPDEARLLRNLGYAGLIPFVVLAALAWIPQAAVQGFAVHALGVYAAVILSFLGAVHWGLFLADRGHRVAGMAAPVWAVIPALAAWGVLLLPSALALPLLAALFPLVFLVDRASLKGRDLPHRYLLLRGNLTLAATLSVIAGAIAVTGA